MSAKVLVLTRQTDGRCPSCDASHDPVVMGVYATLAQVEARMDRVAKVNTQFKLRRPSATTWRMGPEDDEGFFGARPITFRAIAADHHPEPAP